MSDKKPATYQGANPPGGAPPASPQGGGSSPLAGGLGYVPGQILLLIRHPAELSQPEWESILSAINTRLSEVFTTVTLAPVDEPVVFRGAGGPEFALWLTQFTPASEPDFEIRVAQAINRAWAGVGPAMPGFVLKQGPPPTGVVGKVMWTLQNWVNRGLWRINQFITGLFGPPAAKPPLPPAITASPNGTLLASSSGTGQGTGGPGGWPVEVGQPADLGPNLMAMNLHLSPPGPPVTIAVLDTWPDPIPQSIPTETWFAKEDAHRMRKHDRCPVEGDYLACNNYKLSSHGLFVASIIRRLLPDAVRFPITIREALNEWGIGTISGIARLLKDLHDETQPLVINLSLTVHPCLSELIQRGVPAGWPFAVHIIDPLYTVCDFLARQGIVIVAAAGNHACGAVKADDADVVLEPAAFESVIGVAAVDTALKRAPYSFASGKRGSPNGPRRGFAAIGGGVDGPDRDGVRWSRAEVIGPFVDDFPRRPAPSGDPDAPATTAPNQTKYAAWSGTSFATPKVAALAAALLSQSGFSASAQRQSEPGQPYPVLNAVDAELARISGAAATPSTPSTPSTTHAPFDERILPV